MTFDINNINEETEEGYIPGVHCGDKNCSPCTTQQYKCAWLEALDITNLDNILRGDNIKADLEAQDWEVFGEDKI